MLAVEPGVHAAAASSPIALSAAGGIPFCYGVYLARLFIALSSAGTEQPAVRALDQQACISPFLAPSTALRGLHCGMHRRAGRVGMHVQPLCNKVQTAELLLCRGRCARR